MKIFTQDDFINLLAGEINEIQIYIDGYRRKDNENLHPKTVVTGEAIIEEIKRNLRSINRAWGVIGYDKDWTDAKACFQRLEIFAGRAVEVEFSKEEDVHFDFKEEKEVEDGKQTMGD